MKKAFSTTKVKEYLKVNWMKVTLLCLICFVCLKKDLSFQFNLNSPLKVEEPESPEYQYSEPAAAKKKPKAMTHKVEVPKKVKEVEPETKVAKGSVSLMDRFELPFFGKSKKEPSINPEFGELEEQTMHAYVKRFSHVAMSERRKYDIPASIILANALFHSFGGQRDMVIKGNNHFAIPCKGSWDGRKGTYQGKCYREYENAWSSFRDHSLYLSSGKYKKIKSQLSSTDYRGWAYALEKSGFSERSKLARNLISLIEEYDLQEYDY